MQSLFKKFDSYTEYLDAKEKGMFVGISYAISTFPDNNEVIVYLLKDNKSESRKYHYNPTISERPLSYWTSGEGDEIYKSIFKKN